MNWKGANRLYSRQSLERWSARMQGGWEHGFAPEALKQGRRLYKKGLISEISLNEDDVIMTCKQGKLESYSVVEWRDRRLSVRSSSSDETWGKAIAVAGMLEIEELLADEDLTILSYASVDEVHEGEGETTDGRAEKEALSGVFGDGSSKTRTLHLVLDTHFKGLICEAYWLSDDGTRVSALSLEDGSPRANTSEERGRLIMLAARARKSHFVYSPEFGGYLLQNLREVVYFIQSVWPTWKPRFSTEERENVRHIQKGVTEIKLGARASRSRQGGLDIQWVFDSGKKLLDMGLADELLGREEEPMLVPELGVVKLSDESRRLLETWRDIESDGDGSGQLYQLFSLFADSSSSVELSPELSDWRSTLLGEGDSDEPPLKLLDCLRPYQKSGVEWMSRLLRNGCHCLLADEMGLGKTVQVIALLLANRKEGQRALVVCPASVVPVWISEFAKFAPQLKVGRFGPKPRGKDKELDVSVISFAMLRTRIERILRETYEFAIIDEAQFIKNPDSKASRSCRRIHANKRIALTGTPIENKPLDIWPTFQFLMPGLLGSRQQFERLYAENPGAFKARLKTQISPFMLRRTKKEVALELPDKVIMTQTCPVTPAQAREYSRICTEGIARLGDDLGSALRTNRFATLSLLTRLRQASCDPQLLPWVEAGIEDSGKLMVLLEKLIEVLGTGHKVVIFSQFVRFLARVREMIEASFPELPIFELTGSTQNREQPVREFQESSQTAAMLVSLKAASVGITLHSADYVFLLDPWWNPAVESQAIDRVHRIGQTNTVFVYRFIAEGTIEEKIQALQAEKRDLFDSLISESNQGADLVVSGVRSLQTLLALAQSS
ncbi:DEAD/DEAH box helicase [Pelagicoccus sp. SDUM812003]|uniref:DEAD/DEAH box helicase n=1 Tax=Pelagicoccus sp. SDUM812003 TaxID=3041267 RepID=UPI0028110FE7|nr:DEAD/DEAH box helicase [Pelagicoccus sp. SDUM812003]